MRSLGQGGLEKLVLTGGGGARAELYLHGAHVTSWSTEGEERLFLSQRSEFRAGTAIRGGIPVVFPQFSGLGPLPKHGFARLSAWEVVEAGGGRARLRLRDSAATRALWPHGFEAEACVEVEGRELRVTLGVTNTGEGPLGFSAALHTYLRVADLAGARLEGLAGIAYRENKPGATERRDPEPVLGFQGELDRAYLGAPPRLVLREPRRTTEILAEGFPDAVVWNPGALVGGRIADLEAGGWQSFVCVEAAAVGSPIALEPGQAWRGAQVLRVI